MSEAFSTDHEPVTLPVVHGCTHSFVLTTWRPTFSGVGVAPELNARAIELHSPHRFQV